MTSQKLWHTCDTRGTKLVCAPCARSANFIYFPIFSSFVFCSYFYLFLSVINSNHCIIEREVPPSCILKYSSDQEQPSSFNCFWLTVNLLFSSLFFFPSIFLSYYKRACDHVIQLIRCAFLIHSSGTKKSIANTCGPKTLSPHRLRSSYRRFIPLHRLHLSLPVLPLSDLLFSRFFTLNRLSVPLRQPILKVFICIDSTGLYHTKKGNLESKR